MQAMPPFDEDGAGRDAAELAGVAGLTLVPWQRLALAAGLRRRAGRWAAPQVALIAPERETGQVAAVLELAALFLFPGVRRILHSSCCRGTAEEAFGRVRTLVEDDPFAPRVARIGAAAGAETVELKDGSCLRFVARPGSGPGFSADLAVLAEAYTLTGTDVGRLMPAIAGRPDPQLWYTSGSGRPDGDHLTQVRGNATSRPMAFLEVR